MRDLHHIRGDEKLHRRFKYTQVEYCQPTRLR